MNTSFMIGCSDIDLYTRGQVIYNNPSGSNELEFSVCKWDDSLGNKDLEVYSNKFNTTYPIRLNYYGLGSHFKPLPGYTYLSLNFRVTSGYLICSNVYSVKRANENTYDQSSLQITKITIV